VSFFRREKRSSLAMATTAPSQSKAAVQLWASLKPRTYTDFFLLSGDAISAVKVKLTPTFLSHHTVTYQTHVNNLTGVKGL
jgi:hypothetical protein